MGLSWILVKPVLIFGLYGVLFGIVFQARGGPRQTATGYLLVLLAGLLPWLTFSEAVSAAAGSITANTSLVTKIVFPIEILPVSKVLSTMLSGVVSLILLVVFLVYLNQVGWTMILLNNQPPNFLIWGVVTTVAVTIFLTGFWVLCRMRAHIADLI